MTSLHHSLRWRDLAGLGCLFGLVFVGTASEARAEVYAQAHNLPQQTGATVASIEYSHVDVSEDLDDYTFSQAKSVALIGHLGVFAESEIRGTWNTGTLAQAGFYDYLTIDAPGLTGTTGYFTARMIVSGVLLADARYNGTLYTGYSQTSFSALLGGNGSYASLDGDYRRNVDADGFEASGDAPGLMEVTVSFIFGTEFYFEGQLTVRTFASGNTAFSNIWAWSRAEFGHTAYVEGVDSVFTENDELVSGFTITSLSGADYLEGFENAAIPEPAAWTVTVGAAALAGAMLRRRRRT
jgi:hypothetical protein